jgi:predicted ATPase
VQGVLTARMDRLPAEEKALLQTLAVIGREFAASLLRKVVTQSEADLHRLLARLQAAEFIYEQPAFPDVEYIFKHALTQEVAYNSLLIERRKVLHERTAQAMEDVYRHRLEDHYSELAYHYSRSSNTQKAVDYLQLAGQQAVQRSAHAEAITHLTTALELLKTLPNTRECRQRELALQTALGVPLIATKGWAAPEVERIYSRAQDLCQQIAETPQLFSTLFGLWNIYLLRAELQTARQLGEQLLSLAQSEQDPALLLEAHRALGPTLLCLGEVALAQEHMEQAVALYDPQQHGSHAFRYALDPRMICLSLWALALWHSGYPDQALQKSDEALKLARELSHPFSLAFALWSTAEPYRFRREWKVVQERAAAAITLSTEQGFAQLLAQGTILQGWVLAEQGQGQEGIAQMREGLAAYQATGAELWRPRHLSLLAEAYWKGGQTEEGLSVSAEALAFVNKSGERDYEAELYRLKGELTLQKQSDVRGPASEVSKSQSLDPKSRGEAEECFLKAIAIARNQQAKSLELRAIMSLVRLRQAQAQNPATRNMQHVSRATQHETRTALNEAHQMLLEVYNWFTEGFDTKDLQEAKVLLDGLV